MKIYMKFIFSFLIILSAVFTSAAKENYNKGWEAFSNNQREQARKFFSEAVNDSDSKAEALLSLALLDWHETKDADAFNHFQQFYESSDNPYPYLYAMYSLPFMNANKVLSDAQLKFYEKIVNDAKMNGTLRAMLCQKLGEDYATRNNFKKANETFSKIGALDQWQVLGAFDNISGSGFDKDWGAVSKATSDNIFKNDVNADVTWYVPSANKPNKWFYFDYYFSLNNVVVYAQTFVNSPVEQEVYLRTGTSGSLKIWVNDAQIATVPEERNCDMDIYPYKATLNQGFNRILVQIGQSEISGANFLMRVTDADANPITNISQTVTYNAYQKSSNQASNQILPFFAEAFFEEKIKTDSKNLLNYLALGETYLRNDKAYEGTHILKEAEKLAPKSSYISYRLSEAYLRAQNQTDYSREIENIKQNDPNSFIALRNKYQEASNASKVDDVQAVIQQIKTLYGESEYTDGMDIRLLGMQRKMDEMIALAKKLYAKYPADAEYMSLCYAVENEVNNNTKAATSILENYNKRYYDSDALQLLSEHYFNLGDADKGLKALQKRIDANPYASGYLFEYAQTLQRMQRYNEALKVLADVKALAPYMASVYNTEGYIYKELKNEEKAKESFRKSIYYGPTSYDSRTQLRLLENKKEVFELFPKKNLDELIASAPSASDYPEENAVVVMYENQLVFYPEGAQEHRSEIAIKVLNQSGIEEWKDYSIAYNSNSQYLNLDKYEVIKANGQRVKAETDYAGRVVFTNLEVGDVLHLDYRLQDYHTGAFSKHFDDWVLMQYAMPSLYNGYSILIPKDKKFDYRVKNADFEPTVSDVEDMKLYQWISTNQPAIKDEPYMSPYADVAPTLVFSSIPDWTFVSNWYKDLTANKITAHSDYVLKATYAEIIKGNENASQLEKAKLFYEYILSNITYSNVPFMQGNFIPQKASRTIITRLGDCKDVSTLFVALCREADIKANLVLLSSREYGNNILALPTNNFNHCIAQLEVDGKLYYLELTDGKLPFGATLDSDLQSNILPIPYKNEQIGTELLKMDMPFRMKNELLRKSNVIIDKNDLNISVNSVRTGQLASYYRHQYADVGTEDRLKNINQIVADDWNTPVKVSDFKLINIDNLKDSVLYSYTIDAKGALQDVAGMKIFKLPWSDAFNSTALIALDERKYPLQFWSYLYLDTENEEMNITLSKGTSFVESPKNVKLSCSVADYELNFNVKPNGEITARRIFSKKKDVVTPAEYAEFKTFFSAVNEYDNKQYAVK